MHDPLYSLVAPFPYGYAHELSKLELDKDPRGGVAFEAGICAYATSKLCNLLTARAFAHSSEVKARRLLVIAFNPGYTPVTGLGRNLPNGTLPGAGHGAESVFAEGMRIHAGEVLADLVLGHIAPPKGRLYASLIRVLALMRF